MDQESRIRRQQQREMKACYDLWERSPSPSPEKTIKKKAKKKELASNSKKKKGLDIQKNSKAKALDKDAEDDVPVNFDDDSADSEVEDMGAKESEKRRKAERETQVSKDKKKKKGRKKKKKRYKKKKKRTKRKKKKKKVSSSSSSSSDSSDDDYQNAIDAADESEKFAIKNKLDSEKVVEEEIEIGPRPMPKIQQEVQAANIDYGGALMPGEGDAIAQFVQNNMRIPRRGEVGWTGDEIETLETLGYVMSGSRHKKMNAIRIRKENQVYSAEEKRALALYNYEEQQQRENKLMQEFREIITEKFKS